jgi:two-component system, NtrC family, sensor kinase
MHIEEPATHQLEAKSVQYTQALAVKEQLQKAQTDLEMCQNSQTALLTAFSCSGLMLWHWNLITDKIYSDPQWKKILGYEVEEIENFHKSFLGIVHPADLPKLRCCLDDYLQGCTSIYEVEFRMLSKSGKSCWIQSRGKIFQWDEAGKPVQMAGTHKDITKEKLNQEAAKLLSNVRSRIQSCYRFETILQTAVEEVQQLLQTDRTIICRQNLDGCSEVLVELVAEGIIPLTEQNFNLNWDKHITGVTQLPCQIDIKANLVVPIFVTESEREESQSNHLWGVLIVHHCRSNHLWQEWEIEFLKELSVQLAIAQQQYQLQQFKTEIAEQAKRTSSELQDAQRQLLQNERMANLGQLVVDMTNEINKPVHFIHNTLGTLSQYAEYLIKVLEHYPTPAPAIAQNLQHFDIDFVKTDFLKLLWSMRAGSERIKEIVLALQNFSTNDGQMKKANLHEGLDSVLRILQHRLKEQPDKAGIHIIREFGRLPMVDCYPGELNQVFMNILTNAIDALEEKMRQDYSFIPQILIRTKLVSSHLSLVSSNDQTIDKWFSKKHKIIICISDNGKGILPHIQRRIFEPFFTTKPVGKGKGLGLSISKQIIVEKHQGKLKCQSRLGEGTEMVIEMNATAKSYADIRKHASF